MTPVLEVLALQRDSLKAQALKNPVEMLAMVAGLGYAAVKTAGDYEWELQKWREQLKVNSLRPRGAHLILDRLEAELPQLAEFNAGLDNFQLIVPVPPRWRGRGSLLSLRRLNDTAAKAQALGCHLCWRNRWGRNSLATAAD